MKKRGGQPIVEIESQMLRLYILETLHAIHSRVYSSQVELRQNEGRKCPDPERRVQIQLTGSGCQTDMGRRRSAGGVCTRSMEVGRTVVHLSNTHIMAAPFDRPNFSFLHFVVRVA